MRVIVNSLPKSGTHLLGKVMDLLGFTEFEPGLTGALVRLVDRNVLIRWKKIWRKAPAFSENGLPVDLDVPAHWIRKDWLRSYLDRIPDRSYITAHLPFTTELSKFLTENGYKILFISRDPRDVLVSYINFQKSRVDYPFHRFMEKADHHEQVQAVLKGMVEGRNVLSPFSARLERASGWLRDENTLAVRFEDLIGESGNGDSSKQAAAIRKIAAWCEVDLPETSVKDLGDQIFDPAAETFHKGKIGQWRTSLSQDSLDQVLKLCGDFIEEYGYEKDEKILARD